MFVAGILMLTVVPIGGGAIIWALFSRAIMNTVRKYKEEHEAEKAVQTA